MNASSIFWGRLRTNAEIAFWRYGWIWLLICMALFAAATVRTWWLPQQLRELAAEKLTLKQIKSEQVRRRANPATSAQPDGDEAVIAQLRQHSYSDTELTGVVRSISQIAKVKGLVLAQSEFQTSSEGHGGLRQVQLTLPVRATYPQLRLFVEEVLRQHHGVSMDQLGLKREAVAQSQIDIRLKLSIWIDPRIAPAGTIQSRDVRQSAETPARQTAITSESTKGKLR